MCAAQRPGATSSCLDSWLSDFDRIGKADRFVQENSQSDRRDAAIDKPVDEVEPVRLDGDAVDLVRLLARQISKQIGRIEADRHWKLDLVLASHSFLSLAVALQGVLRPSCLQSL